MRTPTPVGAVLAQPNCNPVRRRGHGAERGLERVSLFPHDMPAGDWYLWCARPALRRRLFAEPMVNTDPQPQDGEWNDRMRAYGLRRLLGAVARRGGGPIPG
jgi:hypothetical protein